VAGLLLMMVSTVPVMIPLMVRRSASTATTLYVSLKNPVSLHPIGILMRNPGTVFPPMFRAKLGFSFEVLVALRIMSAALFAVSLQLTALPCFGRRLEQIQFLLGHVSVQTTERYLGCK